MACLMSRGMSRGMSCAPLGHLLQEVCNVCCLVLLGSLHDCHRVLGLLEELPLHAGAAARLQVGVVQ